MTTTTRQQHSGHLTYDAWMEKVNRRITHLTGMLTSDDLPDWTWYDAYEDGLTAAQAVETFFEEEGIDL